MKKYFQGGIFKLEISIPERYPFEPPKCKFLTPIYHPNVDTSGRICLDILKMPPHGSWKPSINISSVLTSLQLLMSEPNPDDPLMADIADEFRYHKDRFLATARNNTVKYASQDENVENRENTAVKRVAGQDKEAKKQKHSQS